MRSTLVMIRNGILALLSTGRPLDWVGKPKAPGSLLCTLVCIWIGRYALLGVATTPIQPGARGSYVTAVAQANLSRYVDAASRPIGPPGPRLLVLSGVHLTAGQSQAAAVWGSRERTSQLPSRVPVAVDWPASASSTMTPSRGRQAGRARLWRATSQSMLMSAMRASRPA